MKFTVLKTSPEGLSGGEYASPIDDVLPEIFYHKGWDSLEDLHTAIRNWSRQARPGDVFRTAAAAVVAVAANNRNRAAGTCLQCFTEGLNYDDFHYEQDGGVQQRVRCPWCGASWLDRFVLAEQQLLSNSVA